MDALVPWMLKQDLEMPVPYQCHLSQGQVKDSCAPLERKRLRHDFYNGLSTSGCILIGRKMDTSMSKIIILRFYLSEQGWNCNSKMSALQCCELTPEERGHTAFSLNLYAGLRWFQDLKAQYQRQNSVLFGNQPKIFRVYYYPTPKACCLNFNKINKWRTISFSQRTCSSETSLNTTCSSESLHARDTGRVF